jgi:hypothetical protein
MSAAMARPRSIARDDPDDGTIVLEVTYPPTDTGAPAAEHQVRLVVDDETVPEPGKQH